MRQSEKGQAMVMEVLIGVIMLAMVLAISYMAITRIMAENCEQEMESNMADFARSVKEVAHASLGNSQKVTFRLPSCYAGSNVIMGIRNLDNREQCNAICKISSDKCTIMQFGMVKDVDAYELRQQYCIGTYLENLDSCPTCVQIGQYQELTQLTSFDVRQTTSGLRIERVVEPGFKIDTYSNFTWS